MEGAHADDVDRYASEERQQPSRIAVKFEGNIPLNEVNFPKWSPNILK